MPALTGETILIGIIIFTINPIQLVTPFEIPDKAAYTPPFFIIYSIFPLSFIRPISIRDTAEKANVIIINSFEYISLNLTCCIFINIPKNPDANRLIIIAAHHKGVIAFFALSVLFSDFIRYMEMSIRIIPIYVKAETGSFKNTMPYTIENMREYERTSMVRANEPHPNAI